MPVDLGTGEDLSRLLALIRDTARGAEEFRLRAIAIKAANEVLRSVVVDQAVSELQARAAAIDLQLEEHRLRATQLVDQLVEPLPEIARADLRRNLLSQIQNEVAIGPVLGQEGAIRQTGRKGIGAFDIASRSAIATDLLVETARASQFADFSLIELGFPELREQTIEGTTSIRAQVELASREARPLLVEAQADLAGRLSLAGRIVRGMQPSELLGLLERRAGEPAGLFGTTRVSPEIMRQRLARQAFFSAKFRVRVP